MLPKELLAYKNHIDKIITLALSEDIQTGDITSLSTVKETSISTAKLLVKEAGVLAGISLAEYIFHQLDADLQINKFLNDGDKITVGDIAFTVKGSTRSILTSERLVLNFMQHLSGISTITHEISTLLSDYHTTLLDTRKTTPGLRVLEKWAVKLGGGHNHRMGLYDMVMIKDNHVDQCGGITEAVNRTSAYLKKHNLEVKIEVETRNLVEVVEALKLPEVNWIMLDNFSPQLISEALELINKKKITEASGGINLSNIKEYAATGVDYISTSMITQKARALDLSLKISK